MNIKTTLIAFASSALLVSAPAFAGGNYHMDDSNDKETTVSAGVVNNEVTNIKTEADLFMNHLNTGVTKLKTSDYNTAYQQLNDARYWFLAFSDSLATESGTYNYTWDDARAMEAKLLKAYLDLGQTQHIAGNYQDAVSTLSVALALNPMQPEANYQRELAYEAIVDANDADMDDADMMVGDDAKIMPSDNDDMDIMGSGTSY